MLPLALVQKRFQNEVFSIILNKSPLVRHGFVDKGKPSASSKDRWQIELFIKALKQNLKVKVKTFVGTSENALYSHIWPVLINMLLIKYMQFKSKMNWSLSNLLALLRWILFSYRNLWEWLNVPYEMPPITSVPAQKPIPFKGFGKHG